MIPKLSRILCVTDFSETASRALPYAYAVVEPGGEVCLIHVIEHEDVPNPLYAHFTLDDLFNPENQKRAIAQVESHLAKLIPEDAGPRKITTRVAAVIHPDVSAGIAMEASTRRCDAIVIGSHGRSGLAHVLIGSVAEGVIRHSQVPVLVVPLRLR
jgi:universal stress protein A